MFDTADELLRQIHFGEDSSLELKDLRYKGNQIAEPRRDDIADEFAAMANSFSGVIVFGVDDKSKTITGIPEEKMDAVETWIREICNDSIKPQLFCRIRKVLLPDTNNVERVVVRVDIPRSIFVHKSPHGYFYRIGSSKREMEPDVLARLFQQRSQARLIRFDEQVVASTHKSTLNKKLWEKFKTPLSPSGEEEFLLKLKLLSQDEDGNIFPTVSGLLIASEKPQEALVNAFIQAVAYRGTERNAAYQIDAKDITGPLDDQIAGAYKFVEKNMRIFAVKEPSRRDIPQFSMNAVFEALVNAVAHRDYSIQSSKIRVHLFVDRLEIFSPGAITNTMTLDSLSLRQSARNELLTSLLARCPLNIDTYTGERGFLMDKRGEGVPVILTESEKLSGRRPEYRLVDDSELMLTIYAANPEGKCED
jgi:predicted HTH transcriptional regulator